MSQAVGIPKKLGHIWIGPLAAPTEWMDTWRNKHPDWEYTLYDNTFLKNFNFKTYRQIDEYLKRGQYAGVADLMRLEILYEYGGLLAEADSICLLNTDELFQKSCLYTVYENEFVRGKLVSPIQAAPAKSPFIKAMIDHLATIDPNDLDEAWISTGNLFTSQMIDQLNPDIIIFPSHYLIPIHFTGLAYRGSGKVYAKQIFGSTTHAYKKPDSLWGRFLYKRLAKLNKEYNKTQLRNLAIRREREFSTFYLQEQAIVDKI